LKEKRHHRVPVYHDTPDKSSDPRCNRFCSDLLSITPKRSSILRSFRKRCGDGFAARFSRVRRALPSSLTNTAAPRNYYALRYRRGIIATPRRARTPNFTSNRSRGGPFHRQREMPARRLREHLGFEIELRKSTPSRFILPPGVSPASGAQIGITAMAITVRRASRKRSRNSSRKNNLFANAEGNGATCAWLAFSRAGWFRFCSPV